MKYCHHFDHADAREDPATGWILTGDEAYTPLEWEQHGGFTRRGRPAILTADEARERKRARDRRRRKAA